MEKYFTLFFLLATVFCGRISAQSKWIEDTEMNFKISVPANYKTNQFKEGTDKVHAFVSPDQNVAIQIRSFKVAENATIELIMKAFSENIMKGSQQLAIKEHTINNLNGQIAGYKWRYNNIQVIAGTFYSIHNGIAYVIWTLMPENLFNQRNAESDAITGTFTLLNPMVINSSGGLGGLISPQTPSQEGVITQSTSPDIPIVSPPATQSPSATVVQPSIPEIKITDAAIGASIDEKYQITVPLKILPPTIGRINLAFGYTGQAKGSQVTIRWFSISHDGIVKEFACSTPDANIGRGHAYIEFPEKSWPKGEYKAEIRLNDQLLREVPFIIGQQEVAPPTVVPVVLGDYIPLVSEDACLEHLIPSKANIRQATEGQKTWNVPEGTNGKILTMVIQNITKQSKDFNTYINELISSITAKGASVEKKEFGTIQGLSCCRYWYSYNGTPFLYTAIDGPKSFYLLGYVGSADYRAVLEKHHNMSHNSFKKSACAGQSEPLPPTSPPPAAPATVPQGGSVKQIVLDNSNSGYDFATGNVRDGHKAPDPDILNEPWCTPLPALCGNWAKTGKSKIEEVTAPPTSGYISDGLDYMNCKEAPLNEVLVFKLKNGTYAKVLVVKDEFTKTGNGCQHKISCMVQYPAFK